MIARYSALFVFLLLVTLAAVAGASFEAGEWYFRDLNQPAWAVPAWLYGPAWALAWVFAALAAWNAWLTGHYDRYKALPWWLALLLANLAWSFLYFGMHRPGWAWLALCLSLAATVLCMRAFSRISSEAAKLMIPCLAWVAYLWLLNLATWSLNGGPLAAIFF